jgi:protein phosphatase
VGRRAVTVTWEAAGASDVGRVRKGNEDTFFVDARRGVFLVADGMGGHAAGEIASALAADVVGGALVCGVDDELEPEMLAESLRRSLHAAHEAIIAHTQQDPSTDGMGTTMTALVVRPDGTYRMGHVGDSRMYLMRAGELTQVSHDHTWVQREVDEGRLTEQGARRHRLSHILTRALGADAADRPDIEGGRFLPGDLVLLCSDGLTGMITDKMIAGILREEAPLPDLVARLVAEANARGGRDNITAVLVKILAHTETQRHRD